MSRLNGALLKIKAVPRGKMGDRLLAELGYARRVCETLNGKHEELVLGAAEQVAQAVSRDGALTDACALEIENSLLPMREDCKKYTLFLCGHAHIDMNWMWRYDETVQITLDTFRTVLTLMREFPDFTFSQSQASVYRIVEEFAPDMLDEIRARVKEGRWEVTASTWVEADRNMSSAESVARHHLYTAGYLEKLLGIERPVIDFEPDTFGHHQNTPELLAQAGVKYYYHCRGLENQTLYRWQAPSGAQVLCYREPFWYNDSVTGDFAELAPSFCEQFGVSAALRVYGVGEHGGGPTRRDIRRIIDMQSWPIYATVKFGTFRAFFDSAARARKEIPVVNRELNPLFLGCYTTQSRIKKGNRTGERVLAEAEQINAFAHVLAGAPYRAARFEEGWRNVLFNQFHDILPGSGVTDTREYAMGLYQQSYAVANSARRLAMKAIADQIDTSGIASAPFDEDVSTGAGVGFGVETSVSPAAVEFGQGRTRIFHLFNSCAFDRREVVELTVWDLKEEKYLSVTDGNGAALEFQVVDSGHNSYWGHDYTRLLVMAEVPAMGYATCVVAPGEDADAPFGFNQFGPVEHDEDWAIENDLIEAVCDPAENDGAIVITEKKSGEVHIIDGFHYVLEDASRGMTAWVSGKSVSDERLTRLKMKRTVTGPLYNELQAEARFGEKSELVYTIGLKKGAARLDISAKCRWLEPGDRVNRLIPQLRFTVMADDSFASEYTYDIPGGQIRRAASTQELPGIRFIADGRMMLLSDCKYGYRGHVGSLGVTLIRSAFDPDDFPELGNHAFALSVGFAETDAAVDLARMAQSFSSGIVAVSSEPHAGKWPLLRSFARVRSGSVELQAVKLSEDGRSIVLRGVELSGDGNNVSIALEGVKAAWLCDTFEQPVSELRVANGAICFDARPRGLFTVRATVQ